MSSQPKISTIVRTPLLITMCLATLLSGCSSTRLSESERFEAYENFKAEVPLEQVKRIPHISNSHWTPLGEQHLILYKGANRPYLITLKRRCFNLDTTLGIKINSFGSSLSAGTDSISVLDGSEIRCFIDTIHKITKEQRKELVKLGRRDEEEQPVPVATKDA